MLRLIGRSPRGAGRLLVRWVRWVADADGNAYIAVNGQEEHYLIDSIEALRTLIWDVKAGKADHLL